MKSILTILALSISVMSCSKSTELPTPLVVEKNDKVTGSVLENTSWEKFAYDNPNEKYHVSFTSNSSTWTSFGTTVTYPTGYSSDSIHCAGTRYYYKLDGDTLIIHSNNGLPITKYDKWWRKGR